MSTTTTLSPASIQLVYDTFRRIEENYQFFVPPNVYGIDVQFRKLFDIFLLTLIKIDYDFDKSLENKTFVNDLTLQMNSIMSNAPLAANVGQVPTVNAQMDARMPFYIQKFYQFYGVCLRSRENTLETEQFQISYFFEMYDYLLNLPLSGLDPLDPLVIKLQAMRQSLFDMPDNLSNGDIYSFQTYYDFFMPINTNVPGDVSNRTLRLYIKQIKEFLNTYAKLNPYMLQVNKNNC